MQVIRTNGEVGWDLHLPRRIPDREINNLAVLLNLLDSFCFEEGKEDTRTRRWGEKGQFSVKSYFNGFSAWEQNDFPMKIIWGKV
ncbi:hypothetical protein BVC80_8863g6 [Macleaya cordata]|uniref:Uncharacterized protein n=1 Tax=Macleaya cordata TaxID=56857 RepID=A0A200Q5F8_MACCD|nr:hypothetical protein BVC80_8863g6 [Macleaya cordata]